MNPARHARRVAREALREEVPVLVKLQSIVQKRAANNGPKRKGTGFNARVTDNDPMDKDSESNWP